MQFIEYCTKSGKQDSCKCIGHFPFLIMWKIGSCGSGPPPRIMRKNLTAYCQPQKRWKFKAWFILDKYHFPTILKMKNHKWIIMSWGLSVHPWNRSLLLELSADACKGRWPSPGKWGVADYWKDGVWPVREWDGDLWLCGLGRIHIIEESYGCESQASVCTWRIKENHTSFPKCPLLPTRLCFYLLLPHGFPPA